MQNWDINHDGTATLDDLRTMRGNVFTAFDANGDDVLTADEYTAFDAARAHDLEDFTPAQQDQMRAITKGMSLPVSDADGDGQVSRAEFLAGADPWLKALDANQDGGVTLADF